MINAFSNAAAVIRTERKMGEMQSNWKVNEEPRGGRRVNPTVATIETDACRPQSFCGQISQQLGCLETSNAVWRGILDNSCAPLKYGIDFRVQTSTALLGRAFTRVTSRDSKSQAREK